MSKPKNLVMASTAAMLIAMGSYAYAQDVTEPAEEEATPPVAVGMGAGMGAGDQPNEGLGNQRGSGDVMTVTGSRLLGPEDSVSPVQMFDLEDQFSNPADNFSDFLSEQVPSNIGFDSQEDESNASGRSNGDRATGANLRGLGSQNTLTLVNGSRVIEFAAPNNDGFRNVDLNSLMPGIAIGRTDILLDGGSAIYGTDAVSGVVNLVPRYGYEGVEFRGGGDITPDIFPDQRSWNLQGIAGKKFNDGKGSFLAAFDYRQQNTYTEDELGLVDAPQQLNLTGNETVDELDLLLFTGTEYDWATPSVVIPPVGMGMGTTIPGVALTDPLCGQDVDGLPFFYSGEIVPLNASDPHPDAGTCGGYRDVPSLNGSDNSRYTLFGATSYEFSEKLVGSLEASYSWRENTDHTQFATNGGGRAFNQILTNPRTIDLLAANPTLIQGVPVTNPGVQFNIANSAAWATALASASQVDGVAVETPVGFEGEATYEATVSNIRGGFDYQLNDNWEMHIGGSVGNSEVSQDRFRGVAPNYLLAINGFGGADCNINTGVAGDAASGGNCHYYNPFISAGLSNAEALGIANSQEVIDFVFPVDGEQRTFKADFWSFNALFNGVLVDQVFAGGPALFSVGFEHRDDKLDVDYGDIIKSGALSVQPGGAVPYAGEQQVDAVFAELAVPFTDNFRMQFAGRYEDYSDGFDTFNPKVGFLWTPTDRLGVRASWGTSFKSPTITQFTGFIDNTTIQDLAAANAGGGMGMGTGGTGVIVATNSIGDPDLRPQTSENLALGADLNILKDWGPISSVDLTVSYSNIHFVDQIEIQTEAVRISSGICAEVIDPNSIPGDSDDFFNYFLTGTDGLACFIGSDVNSDGFIRAAEISSAFRYFKNFAVTDLEAMDYNLRSTIETPVGRLGLGFSAAQTLTAKVQDTETSPVIETVGVNTEFGNGTPEWRFNVPISMRWGENTFLNGHNSGLTVSYIGEINNRDATTGVLTLNRESYTSANFRHSWDVTPSTQLSFNIQNVTEEVPSGVVGVISNDAGERTYGFQFTQKLGEQKESGTARKRR